MIIARGLVQAFRSKDACDSTRETRLSHHHYFANVALAYSIQDDTVERETDPSERKKASYPLCQYLLFSDNSLLKLEFSEEGYIRELRIYEGEK